MLLLAILLPGCVDPYTPEIKESQESLVVEGFLSDRPGYQYIYISRSSPYNNPGLIPEELCQVWVDDDRGNSFEFKEGKPGVYSCWMTSTQLVSETAYTLNILTAKEILYVSDQESLSSPSPPIDSVYYEMKTLETSDPEIFQQGIQFYLDLDAGEYKSNNYRWELIETWEYHASHYADFYFINGELHLVADPDLLYNCWHTARVENLYTASTKHLSDNIITRHPLHFVSDKTNRLRFRYSLLVRQYSLNDDAYEYWDQMRRQNQESGGLYETQPSRLSGNIHNVNDPDELVLGFFNVSSTSEKRIFASNVLGLHFRIPYCDLDTVETIEGFPYGRTDTIYLMSLSDMTMGPPYAYGWGTCFDCTNDGGTNIKPDFWE